MNSQKGKMIIATSSSIAIIPETRQMNLNLGRFSVSWGSSFIPIYAMSWMTVAMMKNKMIAKCVSSGETPITGKCKQIKAVGNEVRKRRSPWNASKKTSASSLAHKQIRDPWAFTSIKKTHQINFTSIIKKGNPLSFIKFLSQPYHNECNSIQRDEQATINIPLL